MTSAPDPKLTIEAMRRKMAEGANVKAYGKHFAAVRQEAGFATHINLANKLGGDDPNRVKYFRGWVLAIERGEKWPRRVTIQTMAEAMGVDFDRLDPTPFKAREASPLPPAKTKPAKPAKALVAKPAPMPIGGTLAGIEIREVEGGTLVRFEAVLPPGRDDLLHRLLLAAAAAKAS